MADAEVITWNDIPLAYLIRADLNPGATTFVTPAAANFQLGFIVYPAGGAIARHWHRPLERRVTGTSEVLVVRRGRCEIDIYSDTGELAATRQLRLGDVLLIVAGGHGLRMLEDTVLLEVKQGPYAGIDEKKQF